MRTMIARLHCGGRRAHPPSSGTAAARRPRAAIARPDHMDACLLAFDTSTERLAVAVSARGRRLGWNGAGGALASTTLLPRIEALLAEAGLDYAALDAIAFGRGPGAFTGLRTSCAVAQGLAFGAGKPVLPLDSLLLVADDARAQAGAADEAHGPPFEVEVAMDARMGELYAARCCWAGSRWRLQRPAALLGLDALNRLLAENPPPHLAGTGIAAFGAALRTAGARCFPDEADRAAALLRLAQAAWRDGAAVDAALALPLYLRDKVALTTAERAAARAATQS